MRTSHALPRQTVQADAQNRLADWTQYDLLISMFGQYDVLRWIWAGQDLLLGVVWESFGVVLKALGRPSGRVWKALGSQFGEGSETLGGSFALRDNLELDNGPSELRGPVFFI